MKKRILSCFMALALCLTLLPAAALAAEEHQHCVCGKTTHVNIGDHTADTKTAFEKRLENDANGSLCIAVGLAAYGDSAPTDKDTGFWLLPAGAYYLQDAVTIAQPIVIREEVTICLNGKTLQSQANNKPVFLIEGTGVLTLTNCQGTGKVMHSYSLGGSGTGVRVDSGTFNLYGGAITDNTATTGDTATQKGGGVRVTGTNSKFNMYGGTITNNTATNGGGGVYVSGGTFTMNGNASVTSNRATDQNNGTGGGVYVVDGRFTMNDKATISGNTAISTDGGVGVYTTDRSTTATFTMNGGTISGNNATKGGGVGVYRAAKFEMNGSASITDNTANQGGGVYVDDKGVHKDGATFTMNKTASVTGNTASGNTADQGHGGGVYVDSGTFNMNGSASVTKNNAAAQSYGGGVFVKNGGTFNMNGGAISENRANQGGGVYAWGGTFNMNGNASITSNTVNGVYVHNNATFTVSGSPTVTGNTRNSAASNVFLAGSKTITIGDELTGSPNSIGVTRGAYAYFVIANNVNEDYSGIFFSDNTQYKVEYDKTDETNHKLVLAKKSGGTTNPPVTTEHKHCLCGKTHTAIGDHETDTQITFATKLWMDNGVLKKGDNAWGKGTVKRADSVNGSSEGYVLTTGNYYLENDLTLNGAAILIDGDVKLCLNGHTIDRANGNAARDYVIRVLGKNKAHLTLTDCVGSGTIKGGGNGGVDIFGFCTLDMFGGTITGNTNSGVDVGQFGTFNLYGGKISDNSARYGGGGVYTYGKFTMSGGSITNNTATEKGGGVFVDGGTFTVSGNVNITNNTVGETNNNVYLSMANETVIGVAGALSGGARIGVTPETWPVGNGQRAIATGAGPATGVTRYNMTSADMNCFQSDNVEYQISLANNTVLLAKKGGETPEIVPVSGVALNKTSTSISVGNSEKLTATVEPNDATNKNVTWTSSDTSVATVAPDGTVTAVKAGTATITATAEGDNSKFATCTVTVTGGTTPSQPGGSTGGGGSSSGGSDSNPIIKTETKNNADGSTTKTETRRDGSVTQTTTGKDGSVSKTETKPNGSSVTENKAADGSTGTVKTDKNGQTEAKTALSNKAIEDAKKSGEPVKAPVEVEAARNSNTAPTVKVELPGNAGKTEVEIPVSNATAGTVAVLVHPDGTEEILKASVPTENGIRLTVDGSATVKIIDNSKDFIDTRNHWAREEIDFVSARELVNGMSDTIYAPNASATRAQLWTILARQNDADLNGGNTWYEKAQLWSKDKGISDGTEPNAAINRAQMVTMLWRTMGQPAATDKVSFADVPAGSYYAQAVAWAVESGITQGVGGGKFDPTATCTRAQIAAFLARYMK